MTLSERCIDESDADRDILDAVDINLVKKLTSKLPKIGSRTRMSRNSIPNVNPDVNSNSGFSIAGSDVSEDPSEASHPDRVVDGDSTGPESKQEYGHSPETPIRNDGSLLSPNLHSNSLDSGGGGGSFDRKKKKPLFQRMLEKAREEDRDHSKHEKPLFQRILEKAQVDSDLEEKIKNEEYEHNAAQKRMRLPKMKKPALSPSKDNAPRKGSKALASQQPSNYLTQDKLDAKTNSNPRTLDPLIIAPRSRMSSKGIPSPSLPALSPSNDSLDNANGNFSSNCNGNGNGGYRRKHMKKPLYQRLIEKAQIEEERALREKMEQYNLSRLKKRGSNAPSKEEIKERVVRGIARNDHLLQAHQQQRKEQEEKDKDIDKLRESYRALKKQNKIIDILLPSMNALSVLTSQSIPVSSARSEHSTLSLKRPFVPLKRNRNVKLNVITHNNNSNTSNNNNNDSNNNSNNDDDDDDDGYKGDDCSDIDSNQRKIALKKKKLKSLKATPIRRLSQPQSLRKNIDYRDQNKNTENEKNHDRNSDKNIERNNDKNNDKNNDRRNEINNGIVKIADQDIPEISLLGPIGQDSLVSSLNMSSGSLKEDSAANDIHSMFSPGGLESLNSADSFIRNLKEMHTCISTASSTGVLGTGEITARNKGGNNHMYNHSNHNNYHKKEKEKEKEKDKKKKQNGRSINKNEFDFCFDSIDGPSLIDDLDDNLLAKKNNKLRRSLETPSSKVRFVSTDDSKSGDTSSSSYHDHCPSNTVGLQWVSDVLESDENEQGLLMMYSEGFSMFMTEQGL